MAYGDQISIPGAALEGVKALVNSGQTVEQAISNYYNKIDQEIAAKIQADPNVQKGDTGGVQYLVNEVLSKYGLTGGKAWEELRQGLTQYFSTPEGQATLTGTTPITNASVGADLAQGRTYTSSGGQNTYPAGTKLYNTNGQVINAQANTTYGSSWSTTPPTQISGPGTQNQSINPINVNDPNDPGQLAYNQRLAAMGGSSTGGTQTYSSPLTGTAGIQNAINLAQSISGGLQNLSNQGYGNVDINSLPQNIDISQLPQAGSTQQGNTTAPSASAFNAAAVGLPPEFQGLYDQMEKYLGELEKRGQVLNPNIEITPQQVLAFTQQAEAEINPYYSGQLKLAKEGLMNTLGYSRDEIIRSEKEAERKYGRALQNIGESAAEQGFAQSGRRTLDEKNLATDTQNQVDSARRQLSYQAGNAARGFAQDWGTNELPTLNFGQAPQVAAGESRFGKGADSPLYQLSPEVYNGLIGEQEFARRGAVASRTSGLEEAFRSSEALKQARALTL